MDLNALTTIVWFFSAFFFLLHTLVFLRGKRVIKQSKVILEAINLAIFLYLFQRIAEYSDSNSNGVYLKYLFIGIMILFVISIVSGIFTGDYKVHTANKEILLKSVDTAIASVMSIRAVTQEKENKTLFILEEINKKIEIKETVTISEHKNYNLKFKKGFNHDLKKQILTQINDQLEQYDELPMDKQMIALKIGGSIFLMIMTLLATSYFIMETRLLNFEEEPVPNEIYFIEKDIRYSDKDEIRKIHNSLHDTYNFRLKGITYDEAVTKTKYILEYGTTGKVIYVGQERLYIYVPDSERGNKSLLHWICWKVHTLYDKSEGTYYWSSRGEKLYKIVENIVGN